MIVSIIRIKMLDFNGSAVPAFFDHLQGLAWKWKNYKCCD